MADQKPTISEPDDVEMKEFEPEQFEKFKPVIIDLIQYYYLNNPTGGYCHIALDDGNLGDESLFFCQEECEKNNDELGYLIATILRHFAEDEREEMYENNWWGVKDKRGSHKRCRGEDD